MADNTHDDATDDVAQTEAEATATETAAEPTSHDDTDAEAASDDAGFDGAFDAERAQRTIEAQREAERKAKREAKEAREALSEAQERIKAFEREKMTDEERRNARLKELEDEIAEARKANELAQQRTRDLAIESALSKAFGNPDIGVQSVDAAIKLTNLTSIELDDDGVPTDESIAKTVAATMEAYPFLRVQRKASTGANANPARNQKPAETVEQRRARLAGDSGVSPFDSAWAQDHGGGVRQSN